MSTYETLIGVLKMVSDGTYLVELDNGKAVTIEFNEGQEIPPLDRYMAISAIPTGDDCWLASSQLPTFTLLTEKGDHNG